MKQRHPTRRLQCTIALDRVVRAHTICCDAYQWNALTHTIKLVVLLMATSPSSQGSARKRPAGTTASLDMGHRPSDSKAYLKQHHPTRRMQCTTALDRVVRAHTISCDTYRSNVHAHRHTRGVIDASIPIVAGLSTRGSASYYRRKCEERERPSRE